MVSQKLARNKILRPAQATLGSEVTLTRKEVVPETWIRNKILWPTPATSGIEVLLAHHPKFLITNAVPIKKNDTESSATGTQEADSISYRLPRKLLRTSPRSN